MSSSRPPDGGPPSRDSSSGTETTSSRPKGRGPSASSRAVWQRDGHAAFHVRDARPVAATLVPAERPRGSGAEREDGVVVAEQRDLRLARAAQRRVQREPAGRLHELRLEPVALGLEREHAGQPVERFEIAARRVHVHPGGEIAEQEVELGCGPLAHARGLGEGDRGKLGRQASAGGAAEGGPALDVGRVDHLAVAADVAALAADDEHHEVVVAARSTPGAASSSGRGRRRRARARASRRRPRRVRCPRGRSTARPARRGSGGTPRSRAA